MTASTTNQWKLGLFVLSGFALLLATAFWIGSRRFKSEIVIAYSYFDEPVTGLDVGSPVRFRGMTIGSIKEIRVASDRHHLEVASSIDIAKLEQIGLREPGEIAREGVNVPENLRAQIERSLVTGVAFVQTDFFDPQRYPKPDYPFPVPANTVHSVPSQQKSLQDGLQDLLRSVPELLERATSLVASLERDLAAADLPTLSRDVHGAMASLQSSIGGVRWDLLDADLRGALTDVRTALTDVRALLGGLNDGDGSLAKLIQHAADAVSRFDGAVVDADLPGTTAAFRNLAKGYTAVGPEAADLMPTLRRAAESIRRLADMLERDPSALLRGRATPPDPRTSR